MFNTISQLIHLPAADKEMMDTEIATTSSSTKIKKPNETESTVTIEVAKSAIIAGTSSQTDGSCVSTSQPESLTRSLSANDATSYSKIKRVAHQASYVSFISKCFNR